MSLQIYRCNEFKNWRRLIRAKNNAMTEAETNKIIDEQLLGSRYRKFASTTDEPVRIFCFVVVRKTKGDDVRVKK